MSAVGSGHAEMHELAALYALGALDPADTRAFEAHLRSCPECAAEVRALAPAVAALADAVPQTDPPPQLRDRVLRSVGARDSAAVVPMPIRTRPAIAPWLAAAASLAAAVGLGVYDFQLRGRVDALSQDLAQARVRLETTERDIANARRTASDAQSTVLVISAPDLQRSDLAGQAPVAPQASARAFWSRSRGLVFAASDLPALPAGRTYQLWIVPAAGAPVSAGLFAPDASGRIQGVVAMPLDVTRAAAIALTIEPAGGVPAPTGAKYLVGTVSGL